jgi:hypothetical protein
MIVKTSPKLLMFSIDNLELPQPQDIFKRAYFSDSLLQGRNSNTQAMKSTDTRPLYNSLKDPQRRMFFLIHFIILPPFL